MNRVCRLPSKLKLFTTASTHQQRSFSLSQKSLQTQEFVAIYPSSKQQEPEWVPAYDEPTLKREIRKDEALEVKRKRLIWESRKRGILETDLLLGTFIEKYIDSMSESALVQYDKLLSENDWDIYYWATGAKKVPENIQEFEFWGKLVAHSKNPERKILRMPDL